jgi:hypothetical protein
MMTLHNLHGAVLRDRRKRNVFHRNLAEKKLAGTAEHFSGRTTCHDHATKVGKAAIGDDDVSASSSLKARTRRARYGYFEEVDTGRRNQFYTTRPWWNEWS